MEKLLIRINGFGKFQKLILLLIALNSLFTAILVYGSVFTSAHHGLKCIDTTNNITVDNTCQAWTSLKNNLSATQMYECEFSYEYYGNTLVSEWGLQCDKAYLASFLQTAFMVIYSIYFLLYKASQFKASQFSFTVSVFNKISINSVLNLCSFLNSDPDTSKL